MFSCVVTKVEGEEVTISTLASDSLMLCSCSLECKTTILEGAMRPLYIILNLKQIKVCQQESPNAAQAKCTMPKVNSWWMFSILKKLRNNPKCQIKISKTVFKKNQRRTWQILNEKLEYLEERIFLYKLLFSFPLYPVWRREPKIVNVRKVK